MDSNEFKANFGEVAKAYGFQRAFEGWFREFPEIIQVLDLQKSNYGNFYYLNIKLYIQDVFGTRYVKSKNLVKNDSGDVFLRQPEMYNKFFDLELDLQPHERQEGIDSMFTQFLSPIFEKACSREGIITLNRSGELYILPAVKKELGI